MNRWFTCLATFVFLASAFLLARGESDDPAKEKGPSTAKGYQSPENLRIAVLDVGSVFKRCNRFKARMDEMKAKVDAAEQKVVETQKHAKELQEQQKTAPFDSPVRESAGKQFAELAVLLQAEVTIQKDQFMREEGKIYWDIMQNIKREIERSCHRHGIHFVLRVNCDPIDPTNRDDILRGINAPIQYYEPSLDITEEVLAALNSENVGS